MVTLRQVEINDAAILYYHLSNPLVLRYSRLKPNSVKEMEEMIVCLIEEEQEKRVIPRIILNEFNHIIGLITLWDVNSFRREGFLATLIGVEHWGKGYNQIAKDLFLDEIFTFDHMERVYLLVRNYNERSIAACNKLSYIDSANFMEEMEIREFYQDKIAEDHIIFYIDKENYVIEEASL